MRIFTTFSLFLLIPIIPLSATDSTRETQVPYALVISEPPMLSLPMCSSPVNCFGTAKVTFSNNATWKHRGPDAETMKVYYWKEGQQIYFHFINNSLMLTNPSTSDTFETSLADFMVYNYRKEAQIPSIVEINDSELTLSDGSLWQFNIPGVNQAKDWEVGDLILISPAPYGYLLLNGKTWTDPSIAISHITAELIHK